MPVETINGVAVCRFRVCQSLNHGLPICSAVSHGLVQIGPSVCFGVTRFEND
jgi:hypothetical protein